LADSTLIAIKNPGKPWMGHVNAIRVVQVFGAEIFDLD
jgi:hypothetical protein